MGTWIGALFLGAMIIVSAIVGHRVQRRQSLESMQALMPEGEFVSPKDLLEYYLKASAVAQELKRSHGLGTLSARQSAQIEGIKTISEWSGERGVVLLSWSLKRHDEWPNSTVLVRCKKPVYRYDGFDIFDDHDGKQSDLRVQTRRGKYVEEATVRAIADRVLRSEIASKCIAVELGPGWVCVAMYSSLARSLESWDSSRLAECAQLIRS